MTRFHSSAATDPGGRAHNEDALLDRPDLGLWAVADGAGGHAHGAAASAAVVAALDSIPPGLTAAEMLAQVRLRLGSVHAALLAEAGARGEGCVMASTVVVLIARGTHFACLWAGDSRLYRLRDGTLDQLTRDHSLVQELVDEGRLTEAEADTHPQRNVITRAIGGRRGSAASGQDDRTAAGGRPLPAVQRRRVQDAGGRGASRADVGEHGGRPAGRSGAGPITLRQRHGGVGPGGSGCNMRCQQFTLCQERVANPKLRHCESNRKIAISAIIARAMEKSQSPQSLRGATATRQSRSVAAPD